MATRIAKRLLKMRRQLTSGVSNSPFPTPKAFPSLAEHLLKPGSIRRQLTEPIPNSSLHRLLAPKPYSTSAPRENIPSFAGLALLLGLGAVGPSVVGHCSSPPEADHRAAIARHNDASLTAINLLIAATDSKEKNFACSPASLSVALSMISTWFSSPEQLLLKSNSEDQLVSQIVSDIFEVGRDGDDGPKISAANGLWVDQRLELGHNLMQVVDDLFKATVKRVDFRTKFAEVTREVNSWTAKKTQGLIKEILHDGSVDSSTMMVFCNAVHFSGSWAERFDARLTKEYPFHLINGSVVQAPFMTMRVNEHFVARFDGFKVLRLPYRKGEGGRQFSMNIFLPDTKDGLSALVDKLSSGSAFVEKHIPTDKISLGLFMIPKFKVECEFEASEVFKDLGRVPSSMMKIFHKSFIEVKEQGTEAAAATAVVIETCRLYEPSTEMDFVADHPFVFVIREDVSGLVLFAGQILNPLQNYNA